MKTIFILFLFLVLPSWAEAYEDQTKYLLENDGPLNSETAAAHERSFSRQGSRKGPGESAAAVPDKPARKLGNTPFDKCLERRINELLGKELDASVEVSGPVGSAKSDFKLDAADIKEALLKGEISVEELDPAMVEECRKQVEAKGTAEGVKNVEPASKAISITRNPRKDETCYSKDEYAEVFLFRRGGKRVTFKGEKEGDFKLRFGDDITISKDYGGIIEMKWPDGSLHKIILEPGSTIRIPCLQRYFNKATEQLGVLWALLEGTARFVTPPHRLAPNKYDIEANNSTAAIEGTDFIVQTSKTEDKISVIEGKVSVRSRNTLTQAPVLLSQNQAIVVTPKSMSASRSSSEMAKDLVKSYPDLFPEKPERNFSSRKYLFKLLPFLLLILIYLGYKKIYRR